MEEEERPPLEDDPQRVFMFEAGDVAQHSDEGKVMEVTLLPLLGQHDADGAITVQEISPDVVFEPPPKPEAWLLDTDRSSVTVASGDTHTLPAMAWRASFSAAVTTAGVSMVLWLARRSRARRRAFALALGRLERDFQLIASDPARDPVLLEGSLREREQQAARRLVVLERLTARGLDAARRCPWEARGESSRRLGACSRGLSERTAGVERAAEELRVMGEVERLLGVLDGGGGGGSDSDSEGLSSDDDGLGLGDNGDIDGGVGSSAVRPRGVVRSGQMQSARLLTRANALLGKRFDDGNGRANNTRCVFRAELKGSCAALAAREQQAADRLKLGLQRWDLNMVDRALAHLRLLELPDLVREFQGKREDVRGKLWRLREELREAQGNAAREGYISRLREACVKAETFSATASPEYQSAKQSLQSAHVAELEVQARRIKAAHGVLADPRCNVRLDSASGPALLLNDLPNAHGGNSRRLACDADVCAAAVGRRLALEPAGAGQDNVCRTGPLIGADGRRLNGDGDCIDGRSDVGATGSCQPPSASSDPGVNKAFGTTAVTAWGGVPQAGGHGAGEMTCHHQHLQTVTTVRRSAESQFLAYVTRREDEHRRACDADRKALERREDKEVYRQEYIARLDARNEQEEKRLRTEEKRLRGDEEDRRLEREERERRRDDERLSGLWFADREYFRFLSLADVFVAAGTIAWKKGFSIAPRTALDAAWSLVVAECRGGVDDDAVFGSPFSSASGIAAAAGCAFPATQVGAAARDGHFYGAATMGEPGSLPQYDGMCRAGGAGGWGELAAGGSAGGGDGGDETVSKFWWAWSVAESAAGTVVRAGYSSVGWVLGQTLSLVTPDVQCEIRAVFSLVTWLVSLVLALKVAGWLGADDRGPTGVVVRWAVLAAWLWGRFHDWLLEASRELLLFVAPVPVLVLAYGAALRYFERHRKPGGFWWVRGWDVRPAVSRALPTVVSCLLAWFLGTQSP